MKVVFIQLLILLALHCCLAKKEKGKCSKKALCANIQALNEEVAALKSRVDALEATPPPPSPTPPPTPPPTRKSCKELYADGHREDKAYAVDLGSGKVPVYCHLSDIEGCGSGGFTLVMKIDGSKNTFDYDAALWTNDETYNTAAGSTGLDDQETKLSTYSSTPFNKVCIGMDDGGHKSFKSIDTAAGSLSALIADGQYRATVLGRDAWKSLLSSGSLQSHCNREGFNAAAGHFKVRIGILSNEQNDCGSDDSYVGFGASGSPKCGNRAYHGGDNGDRETATIGYILVQ